MELLRERCCSPPPRGEEQLPVVHPKAAWRHGRRGGGSGRGRYHGLHPPAAAQHPRGRHAPHYAVLLLLALGVLYQAGSHLFAPPQPGLADLERLDGDGPGAHGLGADAAAAAAAAAKEPKLIPRLLHQAYPGAAAAALPAHVRRWMGSWRAMNPGWEVRLYSEQHCSDFVRREFPEYWDAYRRLGHGAERADFFRYMVILRHGGVFADADVECVQPLDGLLHSKDTLVAGWDNEFAEPAAALEAGYVRQRQLASWVFAGAAGHPALRDLCERIAGAVAQRRTFSSDARINALERSGAGLFTDVLLAHAAAHPPAKRDDPWGVRLLPRVRFGAPLAPAFGLAPGDPGVVALHHAPRPGQPEEGAESGSGWALWQQATVQDVTSEVARRWRHRSEDAAAAEAARMAEKDAAAQLYPVSVDFDPPFDLLTHRLGRGERQSGADVGATVTTHGAWQPSVQPGRRPSLVDAVVGSMGGADGRQNVLIDVGAGYGLLSLAAAARGHRVHAFELGPGSLEALEASLEHNGFEHLVQVHKEPLGSLEQEGYTCILPRQQAGSSSSSSKLAGRAVDLEVQRGYGPPEVHAMPAEGCQLMTRRAAGAWAVPDTDRIAALKVSANGWEGFVLRGFEPLLSGPTRPPVLAVEWNPAAMKAAGWRRPLKLLEWLYSLGYRDISHSGFVCDQRWYSITYGIRRRGGVKPEDLAALRQPTWCRLLPRHFPLLLDRAAGGGGGQGGQENNPETLLFVFQAAEEEGPVEGSGRNSSRSSAKSPGSGSGSSSLGSGGAAAATDEFGVPESVAQALAEAALMVADPAAAAAHSAAAAVSDLSAVQADNATSEAGGSAGSSRQHQQQQQEPQQEGAASRPKQLQPQQGEQPAAQQA